MNKATCKRKCLVGLQFQRLRELAVKMVEQRCGSRNGWSLHLDLQGETLEMMQVFWNLKDHAMTHPSYKSAPPNCSERIQPTGDQVFQFLGRPFSHKSSHFQKFREQSCMKNNGWMKMFRVSNSQVDDRSLAQGNYIHVNNWSLQRVTLELLGWAKKDVQTHREEPAQKNSLNKRIKC